MRELRNAIEHAAIVARGQPIRPEHFPPPSVIRSHASHSSGSGSADELAAWAQRALREDSPAADTTLYEQFLELAEPPILRTLLARMWRATGPRPPRFWESTARP